MPQDTAAKFFTSFVIVLAVQYVCRIFIKSSKRHVWADLIESLGMAVFMGLLAIDWKPWAGGSYWATGCFIAGITILPTTFISSLMMKRLQRHE